MNLGKILQREPAGAIKTMIMRLVFSRIGPVVTGAVSTAIGGLIGLMTNKLAEFGIPVSADMQTEVTGFTAFLVYGIINYLINSYAGDSAAALQEALSKSSGMPLEVDKWIDVKTIELASKANYIPKAIPVKKSKSAPNM
jgi:hypothetical protein